MYCSSKIARISDVMLIFLYLIKALSVLSSCDQSKTLSGEFTLCRP